MTTRLQSTLQLLGKESVDPANSPAQGANAIPYAYNAYNLVAESDDLNLPPVDLSSGPGTIDLTAAPLARERDLTIDLSADAANLHSILCYADEDNVWPITVQPGASNGYPVPTVTLRPGARFVLSSGQEPLLQSVDATHKTIDIVGTSGDVVHIIAYFTEYGTGS